MPTFQQTAKGYANLWARAKVLPEWEDRVRAAADKVRAGRRRYEAVQAATAVPWQLVGAFHHLEGNCNFKTHLHNGDPLTRRTTHVPAGRPKAAPANGRSYAWEESAFDALAIKGLPDVRAWSVARMLYEAERYNGWGYLLHGVNSAYLWSGTTLQQAGKYVADGVWSATARSKQVGVVAILKILLEDKKAMPLKEFLEQFDKLAPVLTGAFGTKYEAIAEALRKAGEPNEGTQSAVIDKLRELGIQKVAAVLKDAEEVIKDVVPDEPHEHQMPTLAVEPPPPVEPTILDLLFGRSLTGYKTYITIALAGIVNVAAAVGLLPEVLTPANLAALNTIFAALGGASLVSKIERYAKYAAVLRRV